MDELRSQLLRLRFEPRVESDFRKDYEAGATGARILLHVLAIAMVVSTVLYDRWLLGMPDGLAGIARALQFGLEVPVIALSLAIAWFYPLRRWSPVATVVAAMTMVAGMVAQRHFGAAYGFDVPLVFPALVLTATLTVARLRLRAFLPWAVGALATASVAELMRTHGSPSSIYGVIANWMLFTMSVAGAWLLEHSFRGSWLHGRQLEQQAARDALTDLPNRRHFDAMLVRLVREAVRERKSIALLMLDVDDFKAYNDRYGHPAGDECLRRISRWLGDSMRRPHDFCARLGGEEFGAVWFNASTRDAPRLAEELREGIARLGIPHGGARNRRVVTASGGFVQIVAPASEDKALAIAVELVERADRALYEAKRAGRSRMVISGPAPILRRDEESVTMELPPAQMRG
ncbi:MAG TPA: GGDEF domain-containing protein [Nevskiaceae bacterium]|nr:GGDEF domain-containing protein [Nevskiaceae bacterium]